MVELCLEHAGGRRVLSVTLQIGELAGVVPDAISFCFDACTADTPLEGARLLMEMVPADGVCADCGAGFRVSRLPASCPVCASWAVTCEGGDMLRVKELEVE
jgi:hydrogenase nickel incorporation protein HypA/HybF